ncbi:hypothetical protein [Streptomyces sp. NPDC003032]
MDKMKCTTPGCEGTVEISLFAYLDGLEDGTVSIGNLCLEQGVETECGRCGNEPVAPTDYTDAIRRLGPVDTGQKDLLPKIGTGLPRTDVITYVDSDGNPGTELFIDGVKIACPLLHNIHKHTIDGGRSGEDHAWACSMWQQANDPSLPAAVRAEFASTFARTRHDCTSEWEKCESCENCGDEPCPVITAANNTEETSQ